MTWYYKQLGSHTHVRVFTSGAKCGDLCFTNEEFGFIKSELGGYVKFVDENE